jgi:hypothetical protein
MGLLSLTRAPRVSAGSVSPSVSIRRSVRDRFRKSAKSARRAPQPGNVFFEPLEDRTLMSTYYISPSGNDANSGTSTSYPWKSIAKVNETLFSAGDNVLFQGGQTFSGSLSIRGGTGGSAASYVTFGSYNGRATISSGSSMGAYVLNSGGIEFDNLKFQGTPTGGAEQDGIRFESTPANYERPNVAVNDCEITGYFRSGILVMGDSTKSGFNGVRLTNNSIHDNVMEGILTYATTPNTIENLYIGYNQVFSNYGDGYDTVTGSGIEVEGVNGGIVEHNAAYDNGWKGGNGGVGIWAYSSTNLVFQYNQSYDNYGLKGDDGDGFDFDADTSNSIMQYNFAANNTGGGFELDQWRNDGEQTGDVIRYNVSQNNGTKNNYAGIDLWGQILNAKVYNNVVYSSPASSGTTSDIRISNNTITTLHPSNVAISDNIFVSTGGVELVNATSAALNGAGNITFAGNVYYGYNGTNISYKGTTYTSLASWQAATGQEKVSGKAVGMQANPLFVSPGAATGNPTATTLSAMTNYKLQTGSPVLSAGVSLAGNYGVSTPSSDFFGVTIASTVLAVPGIDQSHAAAVITSPTSNTSTGSTTTNTSTGTTTSNTSTGTTAAGAQLTGTVFGTTGSYNNDGNTIAKAVDGSLTSFFDGPTANGDTVGLNLGTADTITAIKFASRSGWASRMNGGVFQASSSSTFSSGVVNLFTIGSSANPSSTSLTTESVSVSGTYQYVRYVAPSGSFGDIAEFQVFGQPGSKLTGTVIGTSGSYGNDGNTIAKAVDGSLTTYYDGPSANGNTVGLNLGSAQTIAGISYTPRPGFGSRMVGGYFQASNSATFASGNVTLYTITSAPASGQTVVVSTGVTTKYQYVRYVAPNGSFGDVADVSFYA